MTADLTGRWRIDELEMWDRDAIDLIGPGFIEFGSDGTGQLSFIAVAGSIDYRLGRVDSVETVEFSWEGEDEGSTVSGRGSAALSDDGQLRGRIFIHLGDDSWFTAHRFDQRSTG